MPVVKVDNVNPAEMPLQQPLRDSSVETRELRRVTGEREFRSVVDVDQLFSRRLVNRFEQGVVQNELPNTSLWTFAVDFKQLRRQSFTAKCKFNLTETGFRIFMQKTVRRANHRHDSIKLW